MSLDLDCLENLRRRGSKRTAKCPACGETGADKHGEHLFIDADGRFGCVVNPGPDGAAHRKRIFELIGVRDGGINARPRPTAVSKAVSAPVLPPPMPAKVASQWAAGADYLVTQPGLCEKFDALRGWPTGTTRVLLDGGLVGCPRIYGRRGLAFVVQAPFLDDLGLISTRDIGFHHRHRPPTGKKAWWTFHPNEKADGIKCPPLPFVIGGGFVPFAHTIIVTEGQFDAITLAAAAGWLVNDASWPERIAVFGTRGAATWPCLVDAWGGYWRTNARFIVFPDADEAGAMWMQPGGFVETLRRRGHAVRVIRSCDSAAKDLNDLHRADALRLDEIESWVAKKGNSR